MTQDEHHIAEKECNWCFPVMVVLILGCIILAYRLGYDTGFVAGQISELKNQLDNLSREMWRQP